MEVRLFLWKIPQKLVPPISAEAHQRAWKLPPTCMEINIIPFNPMEVAMEVDSINRFIYFHESFHLLPSASMEASTNFNGSQKQASFHGGSFSLGLGLVLWNQQEVCDTRGRFRKCVGVYGSSWKLPRKLSVEAATDGSKWKIPFPPTVEILCTSMEASNNFDGSKSTSTKFHGSKFPWK